MPSSDLLRWCGKDTSHALYFIVERSMKLRYCEVSMLAIDRESCSPESGILSIVRAFDLKIISINPRSLCKIEVLMDF